MKSHARHTLVLFVSLLVCLGLSCSYAYSVAPQSSSISPDDATTGINADTVFIGTSLPLTGPYRARNIPIQHAAEAYFSYLNEHGGVHGRRLQLVVCDDHYDNAKAIDCFNNTLKGKVFALAFLSGSGTIEEDVPLTEADHMPLLGFITGTPIAHEFRPNVFVLRRSFRDEIEKVVSYLCNSEGKSRIAAICGTDTFTGGLQKDIVASLAARNLTPVRLATYSREKNDVEPGLTAIKSLDPQAVILGAHSFSVKPILAYKNSHSWDIELAGVSSQNDALIQAGNLADGVILPQVAPGLSGHSRSLNKYKAILSKYFPQDTPSMTGYEAFLNALVLVEGLHRAGKNPTRHKFITALESMKNFDLGAGPLYKVTFSPTNHEGWSKDSIVLTRMKDGYPVTINTADQTAH